MNHIVNRVLSCRVAKSIEEAKGIVAAGIDSQVYTCCIVVGIRCCFGAANYASVVRVADGELIY